MAQQLKAHVRRNDLLIVFHVGFRRHHSTTAAVLKVTEDIRSNMKDGQVTVLVLLDFSPAFNMVILGLLLCKLKNLYSDGARMLEDSVLNGRTQFVSCGEKESSVGRVNVWCCNQNEIIYMDLPELSPKFSSNYVKKLQTIKKAQ
jgi:hypothetical protein